MTNNLQGQLIGKFGSSRSLGIVWTILGLLLAGVGGFVLSIIPSIGKTIRFDGDASMLKMVGWVGIGVGVLIVIIAFGVLKSQPVFYLYENAIRAVTKNGDDTSKFEDIEDVFLFLYGGFGYRTSKQADWVFIGGKISRYGELTSRFRELHGEQRSEKLYQQLVNGQTVTFYYISYENAMSKSVVASRNLKFPTFELKLTKDALTIDGKSIPVSNIARIKENYWTEKMQILDTEGRKFFETHPAAIFSMDVLYELLVRLQEEQN